ncbi:MAG TPA: 30S ribosomal protein S14 [Methanocorpusculum sp.]|nr:30S ribosomal protein S14 [Methanocorpusculum sp.]
MKSKENNKGPHQKTCGITNQCKICGRKQGLVRKYDIYFCRQCFREWAPTIGFKKMS